MSWRVELVDMQKIEQTLIKDYKLGESKYYNDYVALKETVLRLNNP